MFETFIERAEQLALARKLVDGDACYTSALALLAVHSAIALNDALLIKLAGKVIRDEDHSTAARETEKRCRSKGLDIDGIKHLKKLLRSKSDVSYGNKRTTAEVASTLSIASQRFEAWAYRKIGELK